MNDGSGLLGILVHIYDSPFPSPSLSLSPIQLAQSYYSAIVSQRSQPKVKLVDYITQSSPDISNDDIERALETFAEEVRHHSYEIVLKILSKCSMICTLVNHF